MKLEIPDGWLAGFCGGRPDESVDPGELYALLLDFLYKNPSHTMDRKMILGHMLIDQLENGLRHAKPKVDPNIIYPGKDPDFTFPEE